jgi:hypothetical protein
MIEDHIIHYLGKNLGLVIVFLLAAFISVGTVYLCSKIFK